MLEVWGTAAIGRSVRRTSSSLRSGPSSADFAYKVRGFGFRWTPDMGVRVRFVVVALSLLAKPHLRCRWR